MTRLSVALVLPYGNAREGYFPDTLLELMTTEARRRGHAADLCRVYYTAEDPEPERRALRAWLRAKDPDLVVVERLFDPAPIVALERARKLLVSFGDADFVPGIELYLGLASGATPTGRTRRTPAAGDLVHGFGELLDALASDRDPLGVPGVTRFSHGHATSGPPLEPRALPDPFEPALDAETLASAPPPALTRRVIFGNAGCPFALDPVDNPHYHALPLVPGAELSRLGCAFCHAGGDYQVRSDAEVVRELLRQARYFVEHTSVRELVISDQHPVRYLSALVHAAADAGLTGIRWLFPARADAFVRDRPKLAAAIVAAEEKGQVLELYLSGFEAFSDVELARYNKGVTASELVRAVESMRDLHAAHPRAFDYARTKGHSLVLWNPWTRVADVRESVTTIREHGLGELFDDIGHNRLRLYPDLPISHAAERDGLMLDSWETGDEGAAREKGYTRERPWRFLHPTTRRAWELCRALRARLGNETEVAQLTAALDFRESSVAPVATVLAELDALDASLRVLGGPKRPRSRRDRGRELGAIPVRLGGPCNNGCAHCPNRSQFLAEHTLFERIRVAREAGRPLVFSGREPTLFPAIDRACEAARGDDDRPVGMVTNGRRFSHTPFTARLVTLGLRHASVKVFAPRAELADAIVRDPGAHEQGLVGADELVLHGVDVELAIPLDSRILQHLSGYAELADRMQIRRLRLVPALDAIGLDSLALATSAIESLREACVAADLSLVAGSLSGGAGRFDRIVVIDSKE